MAVICRTYLSHEDAGRAQLLSELIRRERLAETHLRVPQEPGYGVLVLVRGPAENGVRPFMAFVVEKGAPGLKMLGQVKKMGIRSWDTEDFVLQDCRVPDFNHIDADFKKTMIVFNGTRPMVAAFGLGVARALLDFTREKLGEQGIAVRYESGSAQRSATQDRLLRLEGQVRALSGRVALLAGAADLAGA